MQWQDPGGVPYENEADGSRYWLTADGTPAEWDPEASAGAAAALKSVRQGPHMHACMQAWKFSWVEAWSQEHNMVCGPPRACWPALAQAAELRQSGSKPSSPVKAQVFFHNQETQQSTWDRPADLAWRRVPVDQAS